MVTLGFVVHILLVVAGFSTAGATTLKAVEVNAKLEAFRNGWLQAVYDGNDTVYLFGGKGVRAGRTYVEKYSINADKIATVGTVLDKREFASAVWNQDRNDSGSILYFGGRKSGENFVYADVGRFDLADNFDEGVIAQLPRPTVLASAVSDGKGNVYIVGGKNGQTEYMDSIVRYSVANREAKVVARLPSGGRFFVPAVWNPSEKVLYIFAGYQEGSREASDEIIKFNPADGSIKVLHNKIPFNLAKMCAVWAGNEAYLIGGWPAFQQNNTGYMFLRFNASSKGQLEKIGVEGTPNQLLNPACAYVEGLNRIYVFGGEVDGKGENTNKIWYVELGTRPSTPTSPPTEPKIPSPQLHCSDKTIVATLPDAYSCRSFLKCYDGKAYLHHCPDALLYDRISQNCIYAERVSCTTKSI